MKLDKYYRALDHVIVAMNSMVEGKPVLAAKHMQQAMKCNDFQQVLAVLDEANDVKTTAKAKPTLAQALTIVAAKAKPKKKASSKKPFGGKQAPPFKKKTKAGALEISEVDLDESDDGLAEDDLLPDDEVAAGDAVSDDAVSDEDLDLDSLSLDDSDEEMADFDLDADDSDDVMEMPEATSAEALGTDDEIKPGKDGTPSAQDVSETDTQPKSGVDAESQIAKAGKKTQTAAAKRLLSNLHVLERQSATAQAKVKK